MDVPSPKHVPGTTPEEDIPSYYDRPALKPSLYGWTVGLYMFVGGLAAGTQILVTAIEMMAIQGSAPIVFWGRIIAFSGAFLGGILLIADLHTKQRFYNMLQIFRPTSPMSIGTYVLMSFGFWSLVSLALQWLGFAVPATICGALASVAGWFMASYTASLLAATSTPLWAAAPKLLAVRFASSAMATGAATVCALVLATGSAPSLIRIFGPFTALALLVELVAALAAGPVYRTKGVYGPLSKPRFIMLNLIGANLFGVFIPLCLFVASGIFAIAPVALAWLAAALVLAGGVLMRGGMLLAGNESARRPRDYFRFAQPEASP